MAFFQRYLNSSVMILAAFVAGSVACAQQPADEPPITFRTLSIGNGVSPLFYELAPGRVIRVLGSHGQLSESYLCPPDGKLSLYREIPASKPGDPPTRVPAGLVHLSKGGPYIVILTPNPSSADPLKTEVQAVDDSWKVHPKQTARVFNFSKRRAVVQIASGTAEIGTAETHLFGYPAGKGYLVLKVAMMEKGTWAVRWNAGQGIVPNARPTFVITDMRATEEDPNPIGIDISDIFDTTQPPADRLAKFQ